MSFLLYYPHQKVQQLDFCIHLLHLPIYLYSIQHYYANSTGNITIVLYMRGYIFVSVDNIIEKKKKKKKLTCTPVYTIIYCVKLRALMVIFTC